MTLLEILVKELPGMGGWPDGAYAIGMHEDGDIFFDGARAPDLFVISQCSDGWNGTMPASYSNEVTCEQYEAALAESKKVAWTGEGMPPVGCECEVDYGDVGLVDGLTRPNDGDIVKVVAHETTPGGSPVAVVYWTYNLGARAYALIPKCLRPLRSEEERKRDEAVEALLGAYFNAPPYDVPNEADRIGMNEAYSAIAAGKIPHIKIV